MLEGLLPQCLGPPMVQNVNKVQFITSNVCDLFDRGIEYKIYCSYKEELL